jgi:hypothetical protein
MIDIILKNFKKPDEIRIFDKGKFHITRPHGFSNDMGPSGNAWRYVCPATKSGRKRGPGHVVNWLQSCTRSETTGHLNNPQVNNTGCSKQSLMN